MTQRVTSRKMRIYLAYMLFAATVTDSPAKPTVSGDGDRLSPFDSRRPNKFDFLALDQTALLPSDKIPLDNIPDLKAESKRLPDIVGQQEKNQILCVQTTSHTAVVTALLVSLVFLVLHCIDWLNYTVSAVQGENAQLKVLAKGAILEHHSEVHRVLNQLLPYINKPAKSMGHAYKADRHRRKRHKLDVTTLKRRSVKQGLQLSRHTAQHAQRMTKLEDCNRTVGLDCYHKLLQLAEDGKEGHKQHLELSLQVRANTKAQELLVRLAGVVDELRTQLQISVGTQETVKRVANEVTKLKQDVANIKQDVTNINQDVTNIKGARQQLQQQTGMLAELRYELKSNADLRQHLQTRTASLESMHALMTQSLRTQHLSTAPASLRPPKRSNSKLSAVQEVSRETSEDIDERAPLPLEAAHNLCGPTLTPTPAASQARPQGRVSSPHSYVAAVHGRDKGSVQRSSTPDPVRQPRLSDFQDPQAAKYRSRSLQQALPSLLPANRKLRKLTSYPPDNLTSQSLHSSLKEQANAAQKDGSAPSPLRLSGSPPKRHNADEVRSKQQITPALPHNDIATTHGQARPASPKPSRFQLAAQKATSDVKPPAPSGSRVIDQVAAVPKVQEQQGRASIKSPSVRAAAMQGNFNQQWNARALDLLGPAVKQQHLSDKNMGFHGSDMNQQPLNSEDLGYREAHLDQERSSGRASSSHVAEVTQQCLSGEGLACHESEVDSPLYHASDTTGPALPSSSRKIVVATRNCDKAASAARCEQVSPSPFATYQGNGPQLPDSRLRLQSLPKLAKHPPASTPPPEPTPPQPAAVMPAKPTAAHDHTASALTSHNAAQDCVEPKPSLLKQMSKHSSKPLKALVKTLRKDH